MSTDDVRGLSSSPSNVVQHSITGECPVCGGPVEAIVAAGPPLRRYTVEPCGHSIGQLTIDALHA